MPVTHNGSISLDMSGEVSIANMQDLEARIMQRVKSELARILPPELFAGGNINIDPPVEGGSV